MTREASADEGKGRDRFRRRPPTAEIEWQVEEPTSAEAFVASIDELMNEDPDGVFGGRP